MGTVYNAFVIPKVCPAMELVDSEYYTEVFDIEDDEYSVDIMMARAEDEKKQRKLKNVFKGES